MKRVQPNMQAKAIQAVGNRLLFEDRTEMVVSGGWVYKQDCVGLTRAEIIKLPWKDTFDGPSSTNPH